jgi:hypothetical protein
MPHKRGTDTVRKPNMRPLIRTFPNKVKRALVIPTAAFDPLPQQTHNRARGS